jgi:hypothetical protein
MRHWIALVGMLSVTAAASAKELWLSWPATYLRPTQEMRIVEVKLNIECGEVRAVRSIPSDWNISVTRPISGQSAFWAEAGHGASNIPNLRQFDGTIGIEVDEQPCFKVSATIVEHEKEHVLRMEQLIWKQRPTK